MSNDRMTRDEPGLRGDGRRLTALAAVLVAAAVTLHGCDADLGIGPDGGSDGDDPPQQAASGDLTFLRQASSAPELLLGDSDGDGLRDTTIVATRGEDTEVEIFYEDPEDGGEGDRFLEFELEEESLLRYPDGHPDTQAGEERAGQEFSDGDTVHIEIRVRGDTLAAEFVPSGLQFDPDEPAELEIRWSHADPDTDDDGDDELDDQEDQVDLWRQEEPGADWIRSGDFKDVERDRLRGLLESFTIFALAM